MQLQGGAYQSRSLIAAAQRCLNLYTEATPQSTSEPFSATHYCTPGLTFVGDAQQERCRGLYTTFDGTLYAVYNQKVYRIDDQHQFHLLGTFQPSAPSDATARDTPVSMCDNGQVLLIADGSVDGWFVDLSQPAASQTLTRIDRNLNQGWQGSDFVTYQDTFFIMNAPGTAQFYISLSNISAQNLSAAFGVFTATISAAGSGYQANDTLTLTGTGGGQITVNTVDTSGVITGYGVTNSGALSTQPANPVPVTGGSGTGATFNLTYTDNIGAFDGLDFAAMAAQANKLVCAVSVARNLWLIGSNSFEIWQNTGGDGTIAGSFPFSVYAEAYGNWGAAAKYSVANIVNQVYWLSQDKFGHGIIMRGESLGSKRISTHAIEFQISQYDRIDDAIGMRYQQQGHIFYLLTFPSANASRGATWVYDITTGEWAERAYIDNNGLEYRHLANAMSMAYGEVFVGDWRNGYLYTFDLDNYTDNAQPIKRLRSFPHQIDLEASRRIMYNQLIAQMQVGSAAQSGTGTNVVDVGFDAANGTLLENYHNLNSFGSTFTKLGVVEGQIIDNAVVAASAGNMLYSVSGTPTLPDYTVTYQMQPTNYGTIPDAGASMFVIARANSSNNGYMAAILSDGSQYLARLTVMGGISTFVSLGTIATGVYAVTLTLHASSITMAVQRTSDGYWVDRLGNWTQPPATAIQITDNTYQTAGQILLGGTAGIPTALPSISGVAIGASLGSMTTAITGPPVNLELTGIETPLSVGSIVAALSSSPSIGIFGVAGNANTGLPSLSISGAPSFTPGGVASSVGVGSVGLSISGSPSISVTGVAMTTAISAPSVTTSHTVSVTGVGITASRGIPTVSLSRSASITGVGITASRGTPSVGQSRSPSLTGVGITASRGTIGTTVSIGPPAQASAAGFTNLVFNDDFITTSTIATTQNATTGFNWYWAQRLGSAVDPTVECHVGTGLTAATVFNGNTGGGANASAAGGILQINTGTFPNANIISLPGWAMNSGLTTLPPTGTGHWGHCYMEAYIQFVPNQNASLPFNPTNFTSIGWPAFWSWAAEGLADYGFPGSGLTLTNPTEVDFLESFGNVTFGGPATPSTIDAGIIHHDTDGSNALGHGSIDSNWHTYGFLWTSNHVRIYFDNAPMTAALALSPTYALDAQTLFITLGTGPSWQMNVDWVRVWQ